MMLRTNLVILLSVICAVRTLAIRHVTEMQERVENDYRPRACQMQLDRPGSTMSQNVEGLLRGSNRVNGKDEARIRTTVQSSSIVTEARGEGLPRREMTNDLEQMAMPLLLAYKLKFAALFPVILGGLVILISTTSLAGFFFALFAAVLGLKAH